MKLHYLAIIAVTSIAANIGTVSAAVSIEYIEAATSAVMTSGEAVASAATPIDSVASCMVVTFVTAAPWAIAFAGRLSRGDSSLFAAALLSCCSSTLKLKDDYLQIIYWIDY